MRMKSLTAAVAAGLMTTGVWAQAPAEAPPQASPPAMVPGVPAGETKIDSQAKAVLEKLAESFKEARNVGTRIVSVMRMEAPNREPQQMSRQQDVLMERPNKMAILAQGSGGGGIYSDGKQMTVHIPELGKYAQQDAPADFDAATDDPLLAIFIPFGNLVTGMLAADPYAQILEGVQEVAYVGKEQIDGVETDHLRMTQDGDAVDVWITTGDSPRIRRVSPDLSRQLEGQPQLADAKATMTIDFAEWKTDADLGADAFAFAPPAGVEKAESVRAMFEPQSRSAESNELLGKPAPAFELADLSGNKVTLEQHKGKNAVLLDFWATWCGPCVVSLPAVSEIAKGFADQGLVLYAVNLQETPEDIQAFLKEKNLDLNVLLDPDGAVGMAYRAMAIPQTVLIDKEGVVRMVEVGFNPDGKEEFRKKIADVVAGN